MTEGSLNKTLELNEMLKVGHLKADSISPDWSEVTIVVGNAKITAFKQALCYFSPFFKEITNSNDFKRFSGNEIKLSNEKTIVDIKTIVKFCHTGSIYMEIRTMPLEKLFDISFEAFEFQIEKLLNDLELELMVILFFFQRKRPDNIFWFYSFIRSGWMFQIFLKFFNFFQISKFLKIYKKNVCNYFASKAMKF